MKKRDITPEKPFIRSKGVHKKRETSGVWKSGNTRPAGKTTQLFRKNGETRGALEKHCQSTTPTGGWLHKERKLKIIYFKKESPGESPKLTKLH